MIIGNNAAYPRKLDLAALLKRRSYFLFGHRAKGGIPIGNNDLWLAAYAHAEGWSIGSSNTREFARVPGLQVENWAEEAPIG